MSFVLVDRPRPHTAVVTLNRPERMNSMALDVMVPLRDTLRSLSDDNDVRVVVLTGAGRGFCSGADQSGEAGRMPNTAGLTKPTIALRAMELLDDIVLTLRRLHQPVIAAVNGAAIGGGLCLALACDIRVASEVAYFRAAGINNGLTASELGLSYLRGGPDRTGLPVGRRRETARHVPRPRRRHRCLEPTGCRADQAHALVVAGRRESRAAHEPGGPRSAVRAADDR
jgi:hypothetical protein